MNLTAIGADPLIYRDVPIERICVIASRGQEHRRATYITDFMHTLGSSLEFIISFDELTLIRWNPDCQANPG